MVDHHNRTIEARANLGVVVVAAIAAAVLSRQFLVWTPRPSPTADAARSSATPPVPTTGARIPLPGFNWSGPTQTLELVLPTTCRLGANRASFHAGGVRASRRTGKTRRIVMFPQTAIERGDRKLVQRLPQQFTLCGGIVRHTAPPG